MGVYTNEKHPKGFLKFSSGTTELSFFFVLHHFYSHRNVQLFWFQCFSFLFSWSFPEYRIIEYHVINRAIKNQIIYLYLFRKCLILIPLQLQFILPLLYQICLKFTTSRKYLLASQKFDSVKKKYKIFRWRSHFFLT